MRRNMYVAYECLAEKVSGQFLCESESINHIEAHVNGSYPILYKNEPSYPYVMILMEEITESGRENPIPYCYFAQQSDL